MISLEKHRWWLARLFDCFLHEENCANSFSPAPISTTFKVNDFFGKISVMIWRDCSSSTNIDTPLQLPVPLLLDWGVIPSSWCHFKMSAMVLVCFWDQSFHSFLTTFSPSFVKLTGMSISMNSLSMLPPHRSQRVRWCLRLWDCSTSIRVCVSASVSMTLQLALSI